MKYSQEDRIEIVAIYFRKECATATPRVFNQDHPDKDVSRPIRTTLNSEVSNYGFSQQ